MAELKNDFVRCDVEASLCAWEYIEPHNDPLEYWGGLFYDNGVCTVRHHVIDMGPKINEAYKSVSDEWAGYCYDWCFVPDLIDAVKDPVNATVEAFIAAAKTLTPRT